MTLDPIIETQLKWHQDGLQGCMFAKVLARTSHHLWRKVLQSDFYKEEFIAQIKASVDAAVAEEECQILSIILPSLSDEADLILFLRALGKYYPGVEMELEYQKDKNYTLVRLKLPINEGKHAWVLGFINIEVSPETRKSPYTEIVLPTKSKQFLHKKYSRFSLHKPTSESITRYEDDNSVHLADIHIDGITETPRKDKKLWEATQAKKYMMLEKVDPRAKGKVTFTISGDWSGMK